MKKAQEILHDKHPFSAVVKEYETEYVVAFQDALEAMEEYASQSKWINIKEHKPEPNQKCLGITLAGNVVIDIYANWHGENGNYSSFTYSVQYWMPLPEVPENLIKV